MTYVFYHQIKSTSDGFYPDVPSQLIYIFASDGELSSSLNLG